ncbi:MAG: otsA [Verrucomicrobiales bacterium]|nr:otsA [Verrucomicrobiales bacterium]
MEHNLWTRERLLEFCETRLGGCKFIVVANREPYIHRHGPTGIECVTPASGMATALHPVLAATGGTWIAHGGGDADRETVDAHNRLQVPPENPQYTLRRVWLTEEQEQGFYYGMANEGLWPLCHITFNRPVFRPEDWEHYREVNELFADAVIEEAGDGAAIVFIQDYHFALLPRILKQRGHGKLIIAQFWHIPWPNKEVFRAFPWGEELLDGMLGNDLLGFHVRLHCQNFRDTVDRVIEARVNQDLSLITRGGADTLIRPFPISIDFAAHERDSQSPEVEAAMERWRERLHLDGRKLGLGIERLDYTKGIPSRLQAIDYFLAKHPEWRGKVLFVQIAAPSRSSLPSYQMEEAAVDALYEEINAKWGTPGAPAIILLKQHHGPADMMALHRLCDVLLVNALHDGMNLVAKEFAASRCDEHGVLLLSRFTGAWRELGEALSFNPFAIHEIADALRMALEMDEAEQRRRMRRMREHIRFNNVYRWAGKILTALLRFDLPEFDYESNDASALD